MKKSSIAKLLVISLVMLIGATAIYQLPMATFVGTADTIVILQGGATKSAAISLLPIPLNVKAYGAKGDGLQVSDIQLTSGSPVVTSAHTFVPGDAGKSFVISALKKTTGDVTATSAAITLALAPAADDLHGPIWLDVDGTLAGARKTSIHTISGSNISMLSAATTTVSGQTILFGNFSFNGTIVSVDGGGHATLSLNAPFGTKFGCMCFGTDDTVAVQNAIAAATTANQKLFVPAGIYVIAGAPQPFTPVYNPSNSAAGQILFPVINETSPAASCEIEGPYSPIAGELYFAMTTPVSNKFAIFQTTRTTSTTGDCIFGVPGGASWNGSDNLHVGFKNIIFRQPLNPVMTDFDLRNCRTSDVRDVMHDLICSLVMSSDLSTTSRDNAMAGRGAGQNSDGENNYGYCRVSGRRSSYELFEHSKVDYLLIQHCGSALRWGTNAGAAGIYAVSIDRFYYGECPYGIEVVANNNLMLKIGLTAIEQNAPPSNAAAFAGYHLIDYPEWCNLQYDISDPNNYLTGSMTFMSQDEGTSPSVNHLTLNGANNFLITCMAAETPAMFVSGGTKLIGIDTSVDKTIADTWQPIASAYCVLPGAGDYKLTYSLNSVMAMTSGQAYVNARWYNATDGAELPFSQSTIIGTGIGTVAVSNTVTRTAFVRVTKPTSFQLQIQFKIFSGTIAAFQLPGTQGSPTNTAYWENQK